MKELMDGAVDADEQKEKYGAPTRGNKGERGQQRHQDATPEVQRRGQMQESILSQKKKKKGKR